jgi:D-3-phosphoglycerate dehydrogenase / 2-oxoglutarate reductase
VVAETLALLTDTDRFPFAPSELEVLTSAGIEPIEVAGHEADDIVSAGAGAAALVVYHACVDEALLERLSSCRVVARCGAGYDNIDAQAARARGVEVVYVPDYAVDDVADHTLALILACARKLLASDRLVRSGEWPAYRELAPMHRLRGSLLGLLGFGRIARAVADRARAFGMTVVAHDPFLADDEIAAHRVTPVSFEELLRCSDVLSVHAPLTPETRGMIDRDALGLLRPGAILVNTSRGGIVDEAALAALLESGAIGAAGLDVFAAGRPSADHPLLTQAATVVTPHSAAFTEEALAEVRGRALDDVVRVLSGRPALHPVPA